MIDVLLLGVLLVFLGIALWAAKPKKGKSLSPESHPRHSAVAPATRRAVQAITNKDDNSWGKSQSIPNANSPLSSRINYVESQKPLLLAQYGGDESAATPELQYLVKDLFPNEIKELSNEAEDLHAEVIRMWNPGRCEDCGSNVWRLNTVGREKFRLWVSLTCEGQHDVKLKTDASYPPHIEVPVYDRLWEFLNPSQPKLPSGSSINITVYGGEHYLRQSKRKRAQIPSSVQRAVFERDGGRCVLCDSEADLQFDHIVPHSKGGGDQEDNLRLLCRDCNLKKGADF